MLKSYQIIILFMYTFYSSISKPLATIEVLKQEDSTPCIAQQYNSWGPIHAPITIVQNSVIGDMEKILNPTTLLSCFKSHWFKITAGTILTIYLWILYQIRFTCLLIKQHDAWCNWKSIVPITHLQLATHEDLVGQLKKDIFKKYAHNYYQNTVHGFLTLFIQEIQQELILLDTYLKWQNIIEMISCSKFFNFPFTITTIEEKKARLHFLLEIFATQQTEKI
ncbi:hypothetical protein KBB68_01360 [Candidatus Babeliales bacterium]|nr:hypothetical protein [Candidatus Babeliales bacterium]